MPALVTMTDRAPRAAIYLRTSTDRQHTENQRPAVEQLATARGYDIVEVYEEQVSVTKHRPAWEQLKVGAHRGEFDVVIVAAIDRLGRSMVGNVQEILGLDQLGVQVVSAREPWLDTRGPVRQLLIAIFSWVAEEERRQIAARSHAHALRHGSLDPQARRARPRP
jgi:putative DNA-invertase from lambdoid prophage Rac